MTKHPAPRRAFNQTRQKCVSKNRQAPISKLARRRLRMCQSAFAGRRANLILARGVHRFSSLYQRPARGGVVNASSSSRIGVLCRRKEIVKQGKQAHQSSWHGISGSIALRAFRRSMAATTHRASRRVIGIILLSIVKATRRRTGIRK